MKVVYFIFVIVLCASSSPLMGQEEDIRWQEKMQFQISLDALFEDDGINEGASLTAWYFLKDKVGVGPSVGYRRYDTFLSESIVNFGVDAIFLTGTAGNVRSYGAMNTGFGVPLLANSNATSSLASTIYIQPRIGIMINTKRNTAINLSFGYIHQGLDLELERNRTEIELSYNRYILSFGIVF